MLEVINSDLFRFENYWFRRYVYSSGNLLHKLEKAFLLQWSLHLVLSNQFDFLWYISYVSPCGLSMVWVPLQFGTRVQVLLPKMPQKWGIYWEGVV